MADKQPIFKVVPEFFDFLPRDKWTPEIAKIAVERNGWNLQYIPQQLITRELCDIAVRNGGALQYIPKWFLTREDCKLAVRCDYRNFGAVPPNFLTNKFLEFAVKCHPTLINYLTKDEITADICQEAFKSNPGNTFDKIPSKYITKEMCEEMVLRGSHLKDVPRRFRTLKMCRLALVKDPEEIEYIPERILTQEMCDYAVSERWEAIKHVPEDFKSWKLCCEAIRQGEDDALEFIPKTFIEEGIEYEVEMQRLQLPEMRAAYWKAYDEHKAKRIAKLQAEKASGKVEQTKEELEDEPEPEDQNDLGEIIELVEDVSDPRDDIDPESVIDPESDGIKSYLPKDTDPKIVEKLENLTRRVDYLNLGHVPIEYRTPQLCENMVKAWGKDLQFVPEEMKTPELCRMAVRSNGEAIYFVPQELIDEELILLAIRHSRRVFGAIPDEIKTLRMCNQAVQCEPWQMAYVPERLATPEMALRVVQQDVEYFCYIPQSVMTPEICKLAVKLSGHAMEYIPESIKTKEFCEYALKYSGTALKGMPAKYKTPQVCAKAIKKGPGNRGYYFDWESILESVPKRLRTMEFCQKVVHIYGKALKYVPENLKTVEMCSSAVYKDADAIRFVPKEIRPQVIDSLAKLAAEDIERESKTVENNGWDPDVFDEI